MMTGLVIRMAQYLGLQRDGAQMKQLTPYETEMRRRVWCAVCNLDLRASEDQGTEMTIASGSFDTKIPSNINEADISPDSDQMPTERDGLTDTTFARIFCGSGLVMRRMMDALREDASSLEDQSRMLDEIYQNYEQGYFRYATETNSIAYWVAVSVVRLVMAKMTLVVFLPVLFSSPSETFSSELRLKLLVSALEVAEYNHALNAEPACRHWRWIYQTYTHWHAIVYLMIEISRRPWSSIIERAWVALQSRWLIPTSTPMEKNLRIWIPLRKLMHKARRHRDAEIARLRMDSQAASTLDAEDQKMPVPTSSGPFLAASSVDFFRERWRELVGLSGQNSSYSTQPSKLPVADTRERTANSQQSVSPDATYISNDWPANFSDIQHPTLLESAGLGGPVQSAVPALGQAASSNNALPTDWASQVNGLGSGPWLWADTDPSVDVFSGLDFDFGDVNMDLDGDIDWYNWVESAKGMDWNTTM